MGLGNGWGDGRALYRTEQSKEIAGKKVYACPRSKRGGASRRVFCCKRTEGWIYPRKNKGTRLWMRRNKGVGK